MCSYIYMIFFNLNFCRKFTKKKKLPSKFTSDNLPANETEAKAIITRMSQPNYICSLDHMTKLKLTSYSCVIGESHLQENLWGQISAAEYLQANFMCRQMFACKILMKFLQTNLKRKKNCTRLKVVLYKFNVSISLVLMRLFLPYKRAHIYDLLLHK